MTELISEALNKVSLIEGSVITSICHPSAMVLLDFFWISSGLIWLTKKKPAHRVLTEPSTRNSTNPHSPSQIYPSPLNSVPVDPYQSPTIISPTRESLPGFHANDGLFHARFVPLMTRAVKI